MNIGKVNVWVGWVDVFALKLIPRLSFFNGGTYWKVGLHWLKYLMEFSGPKKDNTIYKKVTSEELDKILNELDDYAA
jgi:hypothetical protein